MKTILTIFGSRLSQLGEEGMSRSQAQALKSSLATLINSSRNMLLSGRTPVVRHILEIYMPGTQPMQRIPSDVEIGALSIDDIKRLTNELADASGKVAYASSTLKLLADLEMELNLMSNVDLSNKLGIPVVSEPISPKSPDLQQLVDMDRVEDLVAIALKLGIESPVNIKHTLMLESKCAVLGNLLSSSASILRMSLEKSNNPPRYSGEKSGIAYIVEANIYPREQMIKLEAEFRAEYDALQSELNGLKKLLRDSIREASQARYSSDSKKYQADLAEYSQWVSKIEEIKIQAGREFAQLKIK